MKSIRNIAEVAGSIRRGAGALARAIDLAETRTARTERDITGINAFDECVKLAGELHDRATELAAIVRSPFVEALCGDRLGRDAFYFLRAQGSPHGA